jgi:hypothetical protein
MRKKTTINKDLTPTGGWQGKRKFDCIRENELL